MKRHISQMIFPAEIMFIIIITMQKTVRNRILNKICIIWLKAWKCLLDPVNHTCWQLEVPSNNFQNISYRKSISNMYGDDKTLKKFCKPKA